MRALVDSGASCSLLSGKLYQKLLAKRGQKGPQLVHKTENRKLLSADSSPMTVTASVEADVKINGLVIPFNFFVINQLTYDCIIGIDFLKFMHAKIDFSFEHIVYFRWNDNDSYDKARK